MPVIVVYLLVYVVGLCAGVAANVLLDVRLHRPALSKQLALGALGVLLAVVVYQTSTTAQDWIWYGLWAGTGILAGLGSRPTREPIA